MRTFKEENILYKLMTIGLLGAIVFFLYKVFYCVGISVKYPRELLEPSNIALTNMFLEGKCPYTLNSLQYDIPSINYEYPFLGSLLAAGLSLITGCKAVTAHYVISSIAFVGTGIIGFFLIKPYSKTLVAPLAGMLLFMMCHWRFGYISAAPDDFGLFLFVVTLYLAVNPKVSKKPLICAIMTTLCFYTKQYLVFVALGIFIYMLIYSKREAVKYLLYSVIINVIVAVVISIYWPLYWTFTFFFLYNGTFSSIGFGFGSIIEQMKYLSAIFIGLFLVLIAAVARIIIKGRKNAKSVSAYEPCGSSGEALNEGILKGEEEKNLGNLNIEETKKINKKKGIKGILSWIKRNVKENDALSLFCIEIPVMFVPLIFFGRNDGAFLSYFLQLWMPSIIVVTFVVLESMARENSKTWFILLYGLITAFTVLFGYLKLPFHTYTQEEINEWEKAYAMIEEYRQEGEIYYTQIFAYLCTENGDYNIFCGHDGEVSEVSLETWNNSKLCQILFPYADDIIQKNIDYKNVLSLKAFNLKYSLITFVEGACMNFSESFFVDIIPFYEKKGEITLQVGNMPYIVSVYEVAEGLEVNKE